MIIDVKKLNYVKRIYRRKPDKFIKLSEIQGWKRDEEWFADLPHLNHGKKRRVGTVCPCVYKKYNEVTNRAIVNYISELLESDISIPLSIIDVEGVISMIDGVHTALAYDKLGITEVPVYINSKSLPFGVCYKDYAIDRNGNKIKVNPVSGRYESKRMKKLLNPNDEYDVYYTTGGLHFVGGGSDIWVNDWIELISKRLDVTPVLCIDRIKIGHDSKEWYEAFYKEKFGHLKIVEVNNESDFDEVADLYVIWARAEIKELFMDVVNNCRRLNILHGYYRPKDIIIRNFKKLYSVVIHVSIEESLNSGWLLGLPKIQHFSGTIDWEKEVSKHAKHVIWIGVDKIPLHNDREIIDIPNYYIFDKNLPIVESDVVTFASRCETRKCPHFIDGWDSLAFTNPSDLWWWTKNYGVKFEKTKVIQFRFSSLDNFNKSKRWGISHSSFINEPFGYSIFQAVDYGKIPILNRDWCKDIEYPFRSYTKEEFDEQVKKIKGVSYQERNDILENLRNELNIRYNNPKIWANQYLSIYNGKD